VENKKCFDTVDARYKHEEHYYVSTSDTQCLTHPDRKNAGKDSRGANFITSWVSFIVITSRSLYDFCYTFVKCCRCAANYPYIYTKQSLLLSL
jgi:hypothetical protein